MQKEPLFDHNSLVLRRKLALKRYENDSGFLMEMAADDLQERLCLTTKSFDLGLDLGGHTGLVYRALKQSGKVGEVLRGDFYCADPNLPKPDFVLDDRALPLAAERFDLIVSALHLQLVDDLPGVLYQIKQSLKPDGLFLGTMLGQDTLYELRDCLMLAEMELSGGVSPRVIPFADTKDLGGLLQRAGFALPVSDVDRITVRYDSAFNLMQDLRVMGVTNPLKDRLKSLSPKNLFFRAAEIYHDKYADEDGRIRATFTLASLSGWAPHESQQKPLKPGSAKVSLASVLPSKQGN
ncbi:methyltransferase domain-containing protein [Polycladidibacter stylochi]|uniref:methyltransferase domain-containing protein n=1 Tax=Polycladidibacter stylochi TaxID=1807766 RepID=UPI000832B5AC|nr:methyltransferase domain-containing protein [Pseudovibrio stylochi]